MPGEDQRQVGLLVTDQPADDLLIIQALLPAVLVRHVSRYAVLVAGVFGLFEHGPAVAAVVTDVDDIALIGQKLGQMRIATAVFPLPMQELDDRLGLGLGAALVR